MNDITELLAPILVSASITGLVALSFHLILRAAADVADYALGQYAVMAALLCAVLVVDIGVPVVLAVLPALAVGAITALAGDFAVFRPIERRWGQHDGTLSAVMASIALLWIWQESSRLVFGDTTRRGANLIEGQSHVGDVRFTNHELTIVVIAVAVVAAVGCLLRFTRIGRSLRATGDHRAAAEALGLNVGLARMFAFGLAGVVAATAGVLASPLAGLRPDGGTAFTLNGFVALFLGGASSLWGGPLGALVLMTLTTLVGRYLGVANEDYAVLAVALLVFAARPSGLLGGRNA